MGSEMCIRDRVHCELDSATEFKQKLEQKKLGPVMIPAPGDEMDMNQ